MTNTLNNKPDHNINITGSDYRIRDFQPHLLKFFKTLYGDYYEEYKDVKPIFIEFRPINRHKTLVGQIFVNLIELIEDLEKGNAEKLLKTLDYFNQRHFDIYFGVTPRKERKGDKDSCLAPNVLYIDIDFHEKDVEQLEIINAVEKCLDAAGIIPTITVWSGYGLHLYFMLEEVLDHRTWQKYQNMLLDMITAALGDTMRKFGGTVDKQVKDVSRILRLPYSYNWRDEKKPKIADIIEINDIRYSIEKIEELAEKICPAQRRQQTPIRTVQSEENTLSNDDILKIYTLLCHCYQKGYRNYIIFFLTGWLKKARISYESAKKIVELLAEKDEEKKQRLAVLDRTYGIRGTPPAPEEMRGYTGLQEVLEEIVGEEEALSIVNDLEEVIGSASPYFDSVITVMDSERQIYAVCNFRNKIIARAKRRQDGTLAYRERICTVVPVKVREIIDPTRTNSRRFQIKFEGTRNFECPPLTIQEIADMLREMGFVRHKRLIDDYLSAVLDKMASTGRIITEYRFNETGYFLLNNNIIWNEGLIKSRMPKTPDESKCKKALEALNEFVTKYCNKEPIQITAIKLQFATPFGHVRKSLGRNQQVIVYAGEPNTYKTTISMIGTTLVGLTYQDRDVWRTGYVTYPQLANGCSRHTGAFVINECPSDFFTLRHADIIAFLKGAPETIAGRFLESDKEERKSLATIVLTFNVMPTIGDPYLADEKRMILVKFDNRDNIKEGGRELIQENMENFLHLAAYLRDHISELPLDLFKEKMLVVGTKILEFLYGKILGEIPDWLNIELSEEELDPRDRLIEEEQDPMFLFLQMLNQDILEAYKKFPEDVFNDIVTIDQQNAELSTIRTNRRDIAEQVIKANVLNYMKFVRKTSTDDVIYILPNVCRQLAQRSGLQIVFSDLARALGFKISPRRIHGRSKKVIVVPYTRLMKMLIEFFDIMEKDPTLDENVS